MAKSCMLTIQSSGTLADFFSALKNTLLEVTDWTLKDSGDYSVSFIADKAGRYITFTDDTVIADSTATSFKVAWRLYNSGGTQLANYTLQYVSGGYLATANALRNIKLTTVSTSNGTYITFAGYSNVLPDIALNNNLGLGFNISIKMLGGTLVDAVYYNSKFNTTSNEYTVKSSTATSVNTASYLATSPVYVTSGGYVVGSLYGALYANTVTKMQRYSFGGKSYISGSTALLFEE